MPVITLKKLKGIKVIRENKETLWATFSLFASAGTLICCALPALLVALGMGAVVAGLVSSVPGLVWLSEHKIAVFFIAGILILGSGIARYYAKSQSCPVDPVKARACGRLRRVSAVIYWSSVALYLIGFYFAFLGKYFL